jgi:hypothetical protein
MWRPQLSDPGDELVPEAAVNGHADALVTYNLRHFAGAVACLARSPPAFDESAQHIVDARLITAPGSLEPGEHVGIDADPNVPFIGRLTALLR